MSKEDFAGIARCSLICDLVLALNDDLRDLISSFHELGEVVVSVVVTDSECVCSSIVGPDSAILILTGKFSDSDCRSVDVTGTICHYIF